MCGLIHTKQWKNGVMTGERHNAKDSLSKDMADFMKENIKHLKEDESNYAMSQLNQIFSEWSLHSESSSSSGVKLFRESPNRRYFIEFIN
jgi:hypothetical protein